MPLSPQGRNRLEESLEVFAEVLRYPGFSAVPVVLVLNKEDVFREKIRHSHLGHFFPDYEGIV